MYDCIIIGGGVVGCGVLHFLSKYHLKVLLLEKDSDVANGTTKANSGIVHAGYDPKPGTQKARFNVAGNKMYQTLCQELSVDFNRIGSLVLADKDGLENLHKLLERGQQNSVNGLKILNREQILKIEPNVSDDICYALHASTAGIVSPYEFAVALAESGVLNGGEVKLDSQVTAIKHTDNGYTVATTGGEYSSKVLINAAGCYAAEINKMAGAEHIEQSWRRGEYYLLDSSERSVINNVCFPLPTAQSKGILVLPTIDGNVLVGPTAYDTNTPNDTDVDAGGLEYIKQQVSKTFKNIRFNKNIRVFAGVRAISGDDFKIACSSTKPDFIYAAGICSPGLASAPAISHYIVNELIKKTAIGDKLVQKDNLKKRKAIPIVRKMTQQQQNQLIKQNKKYSQIVCRCEKISEGEIIDAINSPIPATSFDAIKRRVRAGMGRCQGGFCMPRVMEIIAETKNIPITEVTKQGKGSEIAMCKIKEVEQ